MFTVEPASALLEAPRVPRPKKADKQEKAPGRTTERPRERARDRGEVVPLGVEVSSAHFQIVEDLRVKLRWSKRVTIEAAIEALAAKNGITLPAPPADADD